MREHTIALRGQRVPAGAPARSARSARGVHAESARARARRARLHGAVARSRRRAARGARRALGERARGAAGQEFARGHLEQHGHAVGRVTRRRAQLDDRRLRPARPLLGSALLAGAGVLSLAHDELRSRRRHRGGAHRAARRRAGAGRLHLRARQAEPRRSAGSRSRADHRGRGAAALAVCARGSIRRTAAPAEEVTGRVLAMVPLRNRRERRHHAHRRGTHRVAVGRPRRLRLVGVPRSRRLISPSGWPRAFEPGCGADVDDRRPRSGSRAARRARSGSSPRAHPDGREEPSRPAPRSARSRHRVEPRRRVRAARGGGRRGCAGAAGTLVRRRRRRASARRFVMDFVAGETIARKLLRDAEYAAARAALPEQLAAALAAHPRMDRRSRRSRT